MSGFRSANGIAHNTDKSQYYVADWLAKTVSIFRRDQSNDELTLQSVVRIDHMGDNLKYDEVNNKIYTGTINSMF